MEQKTMSEEELMDNVIIFIIDNILLQLYSYLAPENFETSKISLITNEQLIIKLADLLSQPEISKYIKSKEELISLISKNCEFFTLTENKEEIQYNLPENMTLFSILNIPQKMPKEEVKHHLELINLQYNRLYKKGFYWFLSTIDKETVICVQNSLRELRFDEIKIKYFHSTKNQVLKNMRDKVEKNSYQKDAKYLGYNYKNKYNKHKNSDFSDSDTFGWRKGSGNSKSSFDYGEKYTYKKNKYYKYKRNRFNSDNDRKYINNNDNNNKANQEIEIDISKLKYDLNIKYKYTFNEVKSFFEKIEKNNISRPQFLNEDLNDILSNKEKQIVALDELIETNNKIKKNENKEIKTNNNKDNTEEKKINEKNIEKKEDNINNNNINTNIKIPKMNPLSGMSKNFNKFDIVPGNAMPGMMMPFSTTTWIPEANNEN